MIKSNVWNSGYVGNEHADTPLSKSLRNSSLVQVELLLNQFRRCRRRPLGISPKQIIADGSKSSLRRDIVSD
jgi:hypothetical protein